LPGTSFAAPVVAGAAAQLVIEHPAWTPDQLKGALMQRARYVREAPPGSAGVGEIDAARGLALFVIPRTGDASPPGQAYVQTRRGDRTLHF
jgi:subtilisin family serine protease